MIKENQFDTIVIGAGMSGGWAAKEFCEQGLQNVTDGPRSECGTSKRLPNHQYAAMGIQAPRGCSCQDIVEDKIPSPHSCYAFREDAMHFFVKDGEHPYVQTKPFQWIRGYQVGG